MSETSSSGLEYGTNSRINPIYIRDEVYDLLRQGILDHKYPPGYRFDLPLLEKQLGISRTPIRAALHRLEAEGLIEIRPQRGTFVASIDPTEVAESFDIRRVLELYAAEIAIKQVSQAEIAELRLLVDEMCRLATDENLHAVIEQHIALDHQFHTKIITLARNKRLREIYEQIKLSSQLVRVQQKFTSLDIELASNEHRVILEALAQRNNKTLIETLDEHLRLSKTRMLSRLE